MDREQVLNLAIVFCFGFLSCVSLIGALSYLQIEKPLNYLTYPGSGFGLGESVAPFDWIQPQDIEIYQDRIVINIDHASMSSYADTGSMKPTLDIGSNGIRIQPKSEDQVHVGDIISFKQGSNLIVHRVIEKGVDEQGTYFITKGDSNEIYDGKIRFSQIRYVTVGILW